MLRFLLTVLGVSVTATLLKLFVLGSWSDFFFPTLFFTAITTLLIYFFLARAHTDQFVAYCIGSSIVKILAFLVYFLIVMALITGPANEDAIAMLIFYVVFTALEVFFLYKKVSAR